MGATRPAGRRRYSLVPDVSILVLALSGIWADLREVGHRGAGAEVEGPASCDERTPRPVVQDADHQRCAEA